jgi:uncharacterized protein
MGARKAATRTRRRPATTDAADILDAPGDLPDDEPETGPLRRCAVTRQQGERERMLRFVVGPDRQIVPDLTATLPGRGIWLSARGDVIETARTRGAFARAARGQVTVPGDLLSVLQVGLLRRITELLGLARRAGQAVAGFQKGREWLTAGRAGLVVQASDGSAAECQRFLSGADIAAVAPLDATSLGAVFGRDHAVHVVVAPGKLAGMLRLECERLAGLMGHAAGTGTTAAGEGAGGMNKRAGA